MRSVGGERYGLSQAINRKLVELIASVNKPIVTALLNQEKAVLNEFVDAYVKSDEAFDFDEEEGDIVITLEDEN